MQYQQTTNRLTQPTGLESIPTQAAATVEQHAPEQMSQFELDKIAELEAFRQDISAMRCIIESGIADFKNSFLLDQAQPQVPAGVGLVKSRVCQTWVDPKVGYFHPALDEWRPLESVKHKRWFRITNIRAKYMKLTSGLRRSNINERSISLPVD